MKPTLTVVVEYVVHAGTDKLAMLVVIVVAFNAALTFAKVSNSIIQRRYFENKQYAYCC